MESRKNIIVSPSGKLYGSENVLLDFLSGSKKEYIIYVPKNSMFFNRLKNEGYVVKGFKNLKILYFQLFLKMFLFKRSLYLNEGGHISYLKVLANLNPRRKFVVSIRLLEDCNRKLQKLPKNITLISVSNYLSNEINSNCIVEVIHDPYSLSYKSASLNQPHNKSVLTIGIVGRLSESKGLDNLIPIILKIKNEKRKRMFFKFFGGYNLSDPWLLKLKSELDLIDNFKYSFEGFKKDKEEIYNSIDVLVHLNKKEPLGRILFEAADYKVVPFFFNQGGIGELSSLLELADFAICESTEGEEIFASKLSNYLDYPELDSGKLINARTIIEKQFAPSDYAKKVEKFL